MGADRAATFNFQGFVIEEGRTYYRDVLATNGILKGPGHEGVHVGADGVVNYRAKMENLTMNSPSQVHEYDMYITIPSALQREKGVVCINDRCMSQEEFLEQHDYPELEDAYTREDIGYIVDQIEYDPEKDPLARQKIEYIHLHVVRYIEIGRPLEQIQRFIGALMRKIDGMTPDDFKRLDKEKTLLLEE
jgi:hypothetical protein